MIFRAGFASFEGTTFDILYIKETASILPVRVQGGEV